MLALISLIVYFMGPIVIICGDLVVVGCNQEFFLKFKIKII